MGADSVEHHYEVPGLTDRLLRALADTGHDIDALDEAQIGSLGEFHTAGRDMTERLAEAAEISATDVVLDVGAGVASPARYLASTRGARVTALDLVAEFCSAARELNRRTGLADLVDVVQGNATDLRFDADTFDVVWTQHVAMNVEDKHAMYAGFRRVANDSARLALYDVVAGEGGPLRLPVPWASQPGQSFLESAPVIRRLLEATGWQPRVFEDVTDEILARPPPASESLGISLLMNDADEKLASYWRNLSERRTRVLLAVCDAA